MVHGTRNVGAVWLLAAIAVAGACKADEKAPASKTPEVPAKRAKVVKVPFAYGSEKKAWLKQAIPAFNDQQRRSGADVIIEIEGIPMGSGVAVTEIVEETTKPVAWSPASDLFRPLLNEAWTAKHGAVGGGREVAPEGKALVVSPVVIAMWEPMAEALGWPGKAVGWSDILELSVNPKGWAAYGHPEWGLFKLGHTHPEFSNSGLMAVLAEAYAATGQTTSLGTAELEAATTRKFLSQIESSIVHYGKSTGFFADKMLRRGPSYLSAAVVYENLVIDSYKRPEYENRALDVVAVYPREGTFWIDNPYIVLDAPWVTDEQRKGALAFRDYLLSRPVQELAMTTYGFRPADPAIPVSDPISASYGVDPKQPATLLATPEPDVLAAALETWRQTKKTVDIMFVFDRSGSMDGEPLRQAKQGAADFLDLLDDRDRVSLVMFNHEVQDDIAEPIEVSKGRADLAGRVRSTFADGGTALYDAIGAAHALLAKRAAVQPKQMFAIVVLTDGIDENSKLPLAQLIDRISASDEMRTGVRIFTIGYGDNADKTVLSSIAEAGRGAYFAGDPKTIRQVYRDLAAFF